MRVAASINALLSCSGAFGLIVSSQQISHPLKCQHWNELADTRIALQKLALALVEILDDFRRASCFVSELLEPVCGL